MATNFIQQDSIITLTAPGGNVTSGQAILVGSFFGICQ